MKKTATITWVKYTNYGTLLQTYALQQYIKGIGYENCILSDENIIEPYQKTVRAKINAIKSYISCLIWRSRFAKNVQCDAMCQKFKQFYLDIDYHTDDFSQIDSAYDIFICGSDQIWNPGFSYYKRLNSPFYYAGFTNKTKIAYAPSLGIYEYPAKHKDEFLSYIKDFKFLSAREEIGCDIIKSLTGRDVFCAVDPTLLLSEKKWRNLIGEKQDKEKYVLTYFLSYNKLYMDVARDFANRNGLNLKSVYLLQNSKYGSNDDLICGPIEFLQAIDRASYVFTDSFHGTLFSVILETKFITFKRFGDINAAQNERILNLYKMLGVEMDLIDETDLVRIDSLLNFDFQSAKRNLEVYIKASMEYLSNALKG
ncbi:polysaccharide pyruvyl transferase family protein [Phocaeicola sp.]